MTDEPTGLQNDVKHILRGLLMGAADIIPGVSGGTMALILGIYNRLVTAISHVDRTLLGHLTHRRWSDAAKHLDLRFLIALGAGIATGIVALGSLMHLLLEDYTQYTLAAFFGLIAASSLLVGRMIEKWTPGIVTLVALGAAVALWIVRQPALTPPPDALWYVFVCGVIGICAMILPGISGAFILLILGKYHDITGIIKDTLKLIITSDNVLTVFVFAAGCAIGLISFSKVLRWLLARHESQTMGVLCGFMLGSLWKIWPFQRDLTPGEEKFKLKQFEHLSLSEVPIDVTFAVTIGIAIAAVLFVLILDRMTHGHDIVPLQDQPTDSE